MQCRYSHCTVHIPLLTDIMSRQILCDNDPGVDPFYHREMGYQTARQLLTIGTKVHTDKKESYLKKAKAKWVETRSTIQLLGKGVEKALEAVEWKKDQGKAERKRLGQGQLDSPVKKKRRMNDPEKLAKESSQLILTSKRRRT